VSGMAVSAGPSEKPMFELRTVVEKADDGKLSGLVRWVCDGQDVATYGDTPQDAYKAWKVASEVVPLPSRPWWKLW
jgi:2-phospho-L-lactate transferase/gluconeogenesis factor (CofD/UPF0052 family)